MQVEDRVPSELWRIEGEGRGVEFPNGVRFAPGDRTIYHANYSAGSVLAHDFADEPRLSRRPDGSPGAGSA